MSFTRPITPSTRPPSRPAAGRLLLAVGILLGVVIIGLAVRVEAADEKRVPDKPITAEERLHWAFQPLKRAEPPKVRDCGNIRNPIDAFIISTLESNSLPPTPEADRHTLIRRLGFDLTGLPPTFEEIQAFVGDPSPDAYEKLVDRLLASPHYGVRSAQHWLDLARYADTDGFEFDQARPNAWRYRDWVVESFNRDLPYDQFVRFQIAGDEVATDNEKAIIATGFNRCYPDMVDLNDQGLRRQNALNDITETTGLVFLGLTIGCARCHDHKFDPIRQADFYRLQAFFGPSAFQDDRPIASTERRLAHEKALATWRTLVARIQSALLRIEKPIRDRLGLGLPPGASDIVAAAHNKPETDRGPAEVDQLYEFLSRDRRIKPSDWPRLLGEAVNRQRRDLLAELDQAKRSGPEPLPTARVLVESRGETSPTYFLNRGDFSSKGPLVEPRFPAVLASVAPVIEPNGRSSGRRQALAEWLTQPGHPLTSRVIVNRLWQQHLGKGLVDSPSDFGTMGDEPSHPELLDWLALELVERGWSLKAIHRLIVTSATYRRSSHSPSPPSQSADPDNRLLAHQNRRRLDGEALRDALLAASGRLNSALGGPGIFPPLPQELTKLSSKGAIWPVTARPEDQDRRSLYIFVRRNLRYPFFESFDRPDTNASCARRAVTTIAPQALNLLNGELSTGAARALADRVAIEAGPTIEAQVNRAYLLTLGRPPSAAELELAREFLSVDGSSFRDYCLALLNLNEFVYID